MSPRAISRSAWSAAAGILVGAMAAWLILRGDRLAPQGWILSGVLALSVITLAVLVWGMLRQGGDSAGVVTALHGLQASGRGAGALYDLSRLDDAALRTLIGDCEAETGLRRRLRQHGDVEQAARERDDRRRSALAEARQDALRRSAGRGPATAVKRI